MADKKLVITVRESETLMGLFEDGELMEIGIDQTDRVKLEGNIYVGRVKNVVPSMQAAFVDYGSERDGFLSLDDAQNIPGKRIRRNARMQDFLRKGDTFLVQIEKEPLGDKGARLTTNLSLPGRYMVLMPHNTRRGISRRVDDEKERTRLKQLVDEMVPKAMGAIIRTVSIGVSKKDLSADFRYLQRTWQSIEKEFKRDGNKPRLVHEELDMVKRLLRDHYSREFSSILCDDRNIHNQVIRFLKTIAPRGGWNKKAVVYDRPGSLVHEYGLDREIRKALTKRVQLDCGGYLIIEEMETLCAIDVNTGRNIRGDQQRKTIRYTNIEAAAEIPRQLRLRSIGGIVVIDFIDMTTKSDRNKVLAQLRKGLKADKAASDVYDFSEIGVVQLTRERTKPSLNKEVLRECPHCEGSGMVPKIKLLRG